MHTHKARRQQRGASNKKPSSSSPSTRHRTVGSTKRTNTTKPRPGAPHHSTQQSARVLQSKDDFDPSFGVTTLPVLSAIPFLDPISTPLPKSIATQSNSLPLPAQSPDAIPRTVFVQHALKTNPTHHSTRSTTYQYNVPTDAAELQAQLDVRAQHTYLTHIPGAPVDPTQPETNESFILPVIQVGPTSFGLMQLCHSTPRAVHLRMLGGAPPQQLGGSLENATMTTDNQTNHLFNRALHNLRRFIKSDFEQDYMIELTEKNDLLVTSIPDLVRELTTHDPTFLDLRYNRSNPRFNTVYHTRPPPIGKARKALYREKIGPNTFGRVIASQINQTSYPIDQPHHLTGDFINLVTKSHYKYPQPGIPEKCSDAEASHRSGVHILDFGQLLPHDETKPNLLDPAQMPNLKGQLVYPNIFSGLNATPELKNIATLLFSGSSPQLQAVSKAIALKQLSKRYHTTPTELDKIISPSPASHAPFLATINALFTHPTALDPSLSPDEIARNLLSVPPSIDKEGLFKTIFSPKYSDIESLDPRLLLWLLPIIYHFDKPGPIQPSSTGAPLDYIEFSTTERPLPWFQATSLHWVPLNEITNADHHLAPRFNRNREARAVAGPNGEKTTGPQHFEKVAAKYQAQRPDLVHAHKAWSDYIVTLSRPERELLAAASGQDINTVAINDVGQLLTTSTGSIFPARQSHLSLLQTPEMSAYLNGMIQKGRAKTFEKISGGEAKIQKRFAKYPQIGRHCGYNHQEMSDILNGNNTTAQ